MLTGPAELTPLTGRSVEAVCEEAGYETKKLDIKVFRHTLMEIREKVKDDNQRQDELVKALQDAGQKVGKTLAWRRKHEGQLVLEIFNAIEERHLNPEIIPEIYAGKYGAEHYLSTCKSKQSLDREDAVGLIIHLACTGGIKLKDVERQVNRLVMIKNTLSSVEEPLWQQSLGMVWFYTVNVFFKDLVFYGKKEYCSDECRNTVLGMMKFGSFFNFAYLLSTDVLNEILLNKNKGCTECLDRSALDFVIGKIQECIDTKQRLALSAQGDKETPQTFIEAASDPVLEKSSKSVKEEGLAGIESDTESAGRAFLGGGLTRKTIIKLLSDEAYESMIDLSELPTLDDYKDETGEIFSDEASVLQYLLLIKTRVHDPEDIVEALRATYRVRDKVSAQDTCLVDAFLCFRMLQYLGDFSKLKNDQGISEYVEKIIDLLREKVIPENIFASMYISLNLLKKSVERLSFLEIMGKDYEDVRSSLFDEVEERKKLESIRVLVERIINDDMNSEKAKALLEEYKLEHTQPLSISGTIADSHEIRLHYEVMVVSWCLMSDIPSKVYVLERAESNLAARKIPLCDEGLLTKMWMVFLVDVFDTVTEECFIRKHKPLFERAYRLVKTAVENGAYEKLSTVKLDLLQAALDTTSSKWIPEDRDVYQLVYNELVSSSKSTRDDEDSFMPADYSSGPEASDEECCGAMGSYDVSVSKKHAVPETVTPQTDAEEEETKKINVTVELVRRLLNDEINEEAAQYATTSIKIEFVLPFDISGSYLDDGEVYMNLLYLLLCWYRPITNACRLAILNNVYFNVVSYDVEDSNKRILLLKLWMRRLVQLADYLTLPDREDDYAACSDQLLQLLKTAVGSNLHEILPTEKRDELHEVLDIIAHTKNSSEARSLLKTVRASEKTIKMPREAGFEDQPGTIEYEGAALVPGEHALSLKSGNASLLPSALEKLREDTGASIAPDSEDTDIEIDDIDNFVDNILGKREFDNQVLVGDLGHSTGKYISFVGERVSLIRNHVTDLLNYLLRIDYEVCEVDDLESALRPVQAAIPNITDEESRQRCARLFMHMMINNVERLHIYEGDDPLDEDEVECLCLFANYLEWCFKNGYDQLFEPKDIDNLLSELNYLASCEYIELSSILKERVDCYLKKSENSDEHKEAITDENFPDSLRRLSIKAIINGFPVSVTKQKISLGMAPCHEVAVKPISRLYDYPSPGRVKTFETHRKSMPIVEIINEHLWPEDGELCEDAIEITQCASCLFHVMGDNQSTASTFRKMFMIAVESSRSIDKAFIIQNLPTSEDSHFHAEVRKGLLYAFFLRVKRQAQFLPGFPKLEREAALISWREGKELRLSEEEKTERKRIAIENEEEYCKLMRVEFFNDFVTGENAGNWRQLPHFTNKMESIFLGFNMPREGGDSHSQGRVMMLSQMAKNALFPGLTAPKSSMGQVSCSRGDIERLMHLFSVQNITIDVNFLSVVFLHYSRRPVSLTYVDLYELSATLLNLLHNDDPIAFWLANDNADMNTIIQIFSALTRESREKLYDFRPESLLSKVHEYMRNRYIKDLMSLTKIRAAASQLVRKPLEEIEWSQLIKLYVQFYYKKGDRRISKVDDKLIDKMLKKLNEKASAILNLEVRRDQCHDECLQAIFWRGLVGSFASK
ncbi:hypothetical protein GCM10023116_34680 [Kistimonas scapharcae]|uniref:Uncharacterized protein n=2 Tax=Kistimonas scapharcae TaxID=1036133 RepID=A0ABP8V817_9GAMM